MNNIPIFHLHQWKDVKPDDLMDSKLRCVFEMPSENDKVVRGVKFYYTISSEFYQPLGEGLIILSIEDYSTAL